MEKCPSSMLPPHNIPYRIKLLTLLNERRLCAVLEPYNLTPMQYGVLSCLWQRDGQVTSEISETLKALGGTLTCVLDGLESRLLVNRVRDRKDKRVFRVFLTDRGNELKIALIPKVVELQKVILECLTQEEVIQLSQLIDKLLINSKDV